MVIFVSGPKDKLNYILQQNLKMQNFDFPNLLLINFHFKAITFLTHKKCKILMFKIKIKIYFNNDLILYFTD